MVLFIVEKFPSKSEHFITNEILGLSEAGVKLRVLAMRKERSDIRTAHLQVTYINSLWLLVYAMKSLLNKGNFQMWRSTQGIKGFLSHLKIAAIVQQIKAEVKLEEIKHIHAHFAFLPTEIAQHLSKSIRIPFSFTAHAQDIYVNDTNKLQTFLTQAKFIFTCTRHGKAYLQEISPMSENIHCIYHGISLEKWPFQEEKSVNPNLTKILFVGRLVEKKGVFLLLDAVKQLVDDGHKVHCSLVGAGPMAKGHTEYAQNLGLSEKVQFLGYVPNEQLRELYKAHDLLICPSIQARNRDMDGMPNVILEAMAIGLPVIASNLSAIPEIITHRETGMLFNSIDGSGIARHIKTLTEDDSLYQAIRMAARKQLEEKFDVKQSNHKIELLLKSAMAS